MNEGDRHELEWSAVDTPPTTKSRSLTKAVTGVTDGGPGMDFFSSVVAGLLIGLGLDWIFGTGPVFTVIFAVLGFMSGFFKLWRSSSVLEEQAAQRRENRRV